RRVAQVGRGAALLGHGDRHRPGGCRGVVGRRVRGRRRRALGVLGRAAAAETQNGQGGGGGDGRDLRQPAVGQRHGQLRFGSEPRWRAGSEKATLTLYSLSYLLVVGATDAGRAGAAGCFGAGRRSVSQPAATSMARAAIASTTARFSMACRWSRVDESCRAA